MKELSLERMKIIEGGCGYVQAAGVMSMGGLGLVALAAGPVGWAAALIAGAGGMALAAYCTSKGGGSSSNQVM